MTAVAERARHLSMRLSATRDTRLARDAALLVARIGLAWIFIWHGARTLFGAFGGPGVHQASVFFATIAHLHPGTFFAVLNGIIEFAGGIAVGLGILGRIAAAGLAGDMIVAMATVTFGNGMASSAPGGGYEINLALIVLALVVACLGTGTLSLDVALRTIVLRDSASRTGPVSTGPSPQVG